MGTSRFGKVSSSIVLKILSMPLLWYSSPVPITQKLGLFMVFPNSPMLCLYIYLNILIDFY